MTPSRLSTSLCLLHSVFDKSAWLREREIDESWPVAGSPETLHVDNGADFRSRAFDDAIDSELIPIMRFARVLRRDIDAVNNAIEVPWSNARSTASRPSSAQCTVGAGPELLTGTNAPSAPHKLRETPINCQVTLQVQVGAPTTYPIQDGKHQLVIG